MHCMYRYVKMRLYKALTALQAIAQAATYPELHGKAAPAAEASIPIIDQVLEVARVQALFARQRLA